MEIGAHRTPRACFSMKLTFSVVIFSAAMMRSPSFSRSSSSTTITNFPSRKSCRASLMGVSLISSSLFIFVVVFNLNKNLFYSVFHESVSFYHQFQVSVKLQTETPEAPGKGQTYREQDSNSNICATPVERQQMAARIKFGIFVHRGQQASIAAIGKSFQHCLQFVRDFLGTIRHGKSEIKFEIVGGKGQMGFSDVVLASCRKSFYILQFLTVVGRLYHHFLRNEQARCPHSEEAFQS